MPSPSPDPLPPLSEDVARLTERRESYLLGFATTMDLIQTCAALDLARLQDALGVLRKVRDLDERLRREGSPMPPHDVSALVSRARAMLPHLRALAGPLA